MPPEKNGKPQAIALLLMLKVWHTDCFLNAGKWRANK
jgi:hypothetical protein